MTTYNWFLGLSGDGDNTSFIHKCEFGPTGVQVNINTLSEVLHEAEILVTSEELQPLFEQAYHKERTRLEIHGFRKGKAPLAMIKRLYGETIEHDALNDVATDFYRKAMDERNIRPIGQPSMVDLDYKRGADFRFRIQYEVRPEIMLQQYKGISVEKPVHPVAESEIDERILRLRRSNSPLAEVPSVTDEEHVVTGDVQELDPAGMPLIGRKTKGMRFYLADETLAGEIKQSLASARNGETYRVRFEPGENEDRKPLNIDITVTKIEKRELPALDASFISMITNGKTTTLDVFRTNLRADLEKYSAEWSERKLADAITTEIVRIHDFPVPDSLVRTLLDSYVEDVRNGSKDRALSKDFDEEKFRQDSHALAVWQAKWILLKERIAEAEKIVVTDEELERLADTDAPRLGVDRDRLSQYYRQSASARDRLLSEKTMKFLASHAIITEKIVEEGK